MKKAIALVFCLTTITFALPSGGGLTAEMVIERVSQTYSSLRSFRFVKYRQEGDPAFGPGERPPAPRILPEPLRSILKSFPTDLAESTPGRIRLEIGGVLVVSNGETMWAYLPVLNQYLQAAAVPLLQEMWAPPAYYGGDDILRYRRLALQGKRATLRGEETLSLEGQNVRCYVVVVPSPPGSRRLWVDEQRFIVLQDEWISPPVAGPDFANPDRGYVMDAGALTLRLMKADLGPIPDETFEFIPPTGAHRVASFSAPSSPSQGGAYRLAGSGEEDLVNRLIGADVLEDMKAKKPKDFVAEGVDDTTMRLTDVRGKAMVLDFYTTWCKPCQQDLPAIQKLYTDLRGTDVAFLGIDEGEDRETVKNFLTKNGYTFPTLLDSDHALPGFYRTGWVPTLVVINRKGRVAAQYIGAGGEAQLRRALKSAGLNTTP